MSQVQPGDFPLIIRPDGEEPYEIVADPRDVRLWERIGPRNTLRRITENPSVDDYYSLAHIAIRRQRIREVPKFEEFTETHIVAPKADVVSAAGFAHAELMEVIEKAMTYEEATPATITDTVMDFLEVLRERSMDPTRPGR